MSESAADCFLHPEADTLALRDEHTSLTHRQLAEVVNKVAAQLAPHSGKGIAVILCNNTLGDCIHYLACLKAKLPACLVEVREASALPVIERYRPRCILSTLKPTPPWLAQTGYRPQPTPAGGQCFENNTDANDPPPHPDLALLLSTSGSTGSPKLVRLSHRNLLANARSIAEYLSITASERAIASLPIHYSYGLSVFHSHLLVGASVVLTPHSFMRPEFWKSFDETGCTSFAGVPYVYQTLHRLRFDPAKHPTLKTLTQAGGALPLPLTEHFAKLSRAAGARFFVMYGQTEATARMSYVPWEKLDEKLGSIGIAIPGGSFSLQAIEGAEAMQELVYRGDNVMLGYAEATEDLANPDEHGGLLHTGDLARRDADGFYFVCGRIKRIAKLMGKRIQLDEVEKQLESATHCPVAIIEREDKLHIHVESKGADTTAQRIPLANALGVPPKYILWHDTDCLPRTPSGKKNYPAL